MLIPKLKIKLKHYQKFYKFAIDGKEKDQQG